MDSRDIKNTGIILILLIFLLLPANSFAVCGKKDCGPEGYAGKPINLLNGEESLTRTDLTIGNLFPMSVQRRYESNSVYDSPIGYGWTIYYDMRLYALPDGSVAIRRGQVNKKLYFPGKTGFTSPPGDSGHLVKNANDTYTYTDSNGMKEEYDSKGLLTGMADPNGNSIQFAYLTLSSGDRQIQKIEEKSATGALTGKSVTFDYNSAGRLTKISDSMGRNVSYDHDTKGNLIVVSSPLLTSTYGYASSVDEHLLTSIEEGGDLYVNTYDGQKRVTKQTHGTGLIEIDYVVPARETKVTTTIRDTSGSTLNVSTRTVEYDERRDLIKSTDNFGNETIYTKDNANRVLSEEHREASGALIYSVNNTYDDRGNLLTRKEGGPSAEKTTTYTYHQTFSKVLTETVKSVAGSGQKVTTYEYDDKGNATTVTETGLLGDGTPYSYVTAFTYNTDGRITKIDGPRTDVQDVTTFGYDTAGNLTSMTQPLIGTTTYSGHDGLGNPGTITDPNGNTTSYTYDAQGRVLTVSNGGTTTYAYVSGGCSSCGDAGGAGKIGSITFPEGNSITYNYDPYGNLISITDSRGGSITYTNDSEGNRLSELVSDPTVGLQRSLAYQYDALNRLKRITNPDSKYTEYTYDSLGNRLSLRNPNTAITSYSYDALSRLLSVTQPGNIKTSYGYDSNDDLINVTDANSNATTYKYDDMGRVYQVISPDTGTTTYTYDPAGNMTSKTDAKRVTINYSYDALNRLKNIDFPSDQGIAYTYDSCPNGKGRLCGIVDASGTTSYEYSPKGQVTKETKVIDGVTYVTQYSYNQNGEVTSITYPGGRVVNYTYAAGLVTEVTTTKGGMTTSIASNIKQGAFGGIGGLTYGNGLTRTITYDAHGRIGSIITGSIQSYAYEYDVNSNITGITNNVDPTKTKTYAYDLLDRLTGATGPWGTLSYTYDGVGNRKTETTTSGTTNYTYTANKMMSSTGEKNLSFGYDSNGNTISENARQYVYSQNQRLIKAAEGTSAAGEYVYNANGQRVKKSVNGVTTVYHFDTGGRLISEGDNSGNVAAQYVYLNGSPLAKVDSNGINYIHTDHLGTPVIMTDSTASKVWEVESKPFGDDPNITGQSALNIRFPGQYFDVETGLHYNYYRDYNPIIGRYAEADPIGLREGANLYVYVRNSTINRIDRLGLWVTGGHNRIIDRFIDVYNPYLAPQYILAIMEGSKYVDTFQDTQYSYMHYMRDGRTNQSEEAAIKLMNRFIAYHLREYKCNLAAGSLTKAYRELGMALHPVMDSTAPPHSLLPWPGFFPLINLAAHGAGEGTGPSEQQIQTTVNRMMRTLYELGIVQ